MSEVTINSIRKGVISTLHDHFDGVTVSGEEIGQGVSAPYFLVHLLSCRQDQELKRRYHRIYRFEVQHIAQSGTNADAHEMAERLYSTLDSFTIDGSAYNGIHMHHNVADQVLHFFFDLEIRIWLVEADEPKMRTLTEEGVIKHGS
ncbi:phage tail terminator family protein [Paenibacillus guangzhouensis]|uniref:phage tail terminator family protein n=1 Tax=Paenibacillus guangzhouensis TaxID=1473112 RepID=UPI001266CDE4|nr:hypothetical protein [Paenibacillus guangzhouensis]